MLNFIRSAKAPQISAGVMMKNMPWNSMCVSIGMLSVGMQRNLGAATRVPHQVACTPFMNR